MLFNVLPPKAPVPTRPNEVFLVRDMWDDYFFKTSYDLVVCDTAHQKYVVGAVKIAQFSMGDSGSPSLPDRFDRLDEDFFSLGQGEDYYSALNRVPEELRYGVLSGLRDVARDLDLFERVLPLRVTQVSLLRALTEDTVRGRLHRLAQGDAELSSFDLRYVFAQHDPSPLAPPCEVAVSVVPNSVPPSNVHVLIGRNGVGKTSCLRGMAHSLVERDADERRFGKFSTAGTGSAFANLVSVTFSAFDPFDEIAPSQDDSRSIQRKHAIPYVYIGLRGDGGKAKAVDDLTSDFVASAGKCRSPTKVDRWRKALKTLEGDPMFRDANVTRLCVTADNADFESEARTIYRDASSGHKIVLLTITRLVETVDERTLVLLDEPEAHLHPPLLSAFVRTLSALLIKRNGVAIVATHSPVILQEVPKTCVWVLRRSGKTVTTDRPRIETFGENAGILTGEVFGLEVARAGFHQLLQEAAEKHESYEGAVKHFNGQLGTEARAILRGLIALRHQGDGRGK